MVSVRVGLVLGLVLVLVLSVCVKRLVYVMGLEGVGLEGVGNPTFSGPILLKIEFSERGRLCDKSRVRFFPYVL